MEKHGQALYVVSMNFTGTPEQEAVFNEWYNKVHLPDALRTPGFISGVRYEAVRPAGKQRKYIAVYEVENEEIMNEGVDGPVMAEVSGDFKKNYLNLTSDWSLHRWKRIGP